MTWTSPRIKRLSEYIGESCFDYLAGLPDLVLLMDESHQRSVQNHSMLIRRDVNPAAPLETWVLLNKFTVVY